MKLSPIARAALTLTLFAFPVACGGGGEQCPPNDLNCDGVIDGSEPGSGGDTSTGGMIGSETGGGASTGGTATGGASGVTCVGTPSGSCDDNVCDALPGCEVTTSGECAGDEEPCSAFDSQTTECNKQWGCGVGANGQCEAYNDDCYDFDDYPDACRKARGCTPEGPYCFGEAIYDCDTRLNENNCESNSFCFWTPSKNSYCNGSATECADLGSTECLTQAGCTLNPATCNGEPTACADIPAAQCNTQPGCKLSNGMVQSGTANKASGSGPDIDFTSASVERYKEGDKEYLATRAELINRGSLASGPFEYQVYLSKNDIFGDDDDVTVHTISVDFEMEPFGFTQTSGNPFYRDMDALATEVEVGWYYVFVKADALDEVDELEEENNLVAFPRMYIGPTAYDLALLSATHSVSSETTPGAAFTVTVEVQNNSSSEITTVPIGVFFSSDETLDAGDKAIACDSTVALDLAPEETKSVVVNCTGPRLRGSFSLFAELDPADTLLDDNREDNSLLIAPAIEIDAPSPDFVVTGFSSDDYTVTWQGMLNLSATLSNQGADAGPATSVSYYLSTDAVLSAGDTKVCEQTVGGTAGSGGTADASRSCTLGASIIGTYSLIAVADANDDVFEANDTNNSTVAASSLVVSPPNFNLEADGFSAVQYEIKPGEVLDVGFRVNNTGTVTTPAFKVSVYASTDTNISTADTELCFFNLGVLPGGSFFEVNSTTCEIPAVDSGTYYLGTIVDPENAIPETKENDNSSLSSSGQVTITLP